MIRLIQSLPFPVDSETLISLRNDWTRFQDGLVILSEIPDAIRGEYECEAEVMKQEEEEDELEFEGETEGEDKSVENENITSDITDTSMLIPSGNGKLILTASKLYWISDESNGWSVDYKNVLLHAISKPDESRPYIYLQFSCNKIIDVSGQEISFSNNANADGEEEDDEKFVEVNLFVKDNSTADDIFVALSECASLHPCESDSESEFDGIVESESEGETETENSENEAKRSKIDLERFEDAAEN